ncbi:hypothetical protein ITI46_02190 [Streptomyces oryzae]|uniref:Uncharacterized protein n=1 Tax=Streptomyces oryzae TaxID=1434886 RepID=A0ABS3X573_9ACTN|nr:hypothetical protein [Streptomyces oryzae]MBO8190526.1 hypothetical protein [Streptomyces oryzae]
MDSALEILCGAQGLHAGAWCGSETPIVADDEWSDAHRVLAGCEGVDDVRKSGRANVEAEPLDNGSDTFHGDACVPCDVFDGDRGCSAPGSNKDMRLNLARSSGRASARSLSVAAIAICAAPPTALRRSFRPACCRWWHASRTARASVASKPSWVLSAARTPGLPSRSAGLVFSTISA